MRKLRQLLIVLMFIMISIAFLPQNAHAAKKVKLNATKKTLYVGKTATIKLQNNSNKVKWSTSNKKIKITKKTKKSAKIKALKKGTSYLKAKVGKKTYKCKITIKQKAKEESTQETTEETTEEIPVEDIVVENTITLKEGEVHKISYRIIPENATNTTVSFSSSDTTVATVDANGNVKGINIGECNIKVVCDGITAYVSVIVPFPKDEVLQSITYDTYDTGNGVVCLLKNNSKYLLSIDVKIVYYDKNGKMIQSYGDSNYGFESNAQCATWFMPPFDSNYNNIEYASYKININAELALSTISKVGEISVKSDMASDNVTAEVKNNSNIKLTSIHLSIIWYDENENVIGYEERYAECENSGSVDYLTFNFPYDKNYNTLTPTSYRILVDWAYTYDWMN